MNGCLLIRLTSRPSRGSLGPLGELWWLWLSAQFLMVPLFLAAVTMAVALILVGISWFHADAWFDRRWPWISWPLTIVFDGFCEWWVVHTQVEDRRLRRDLPAKIKSQALRCPLCKGPLPVWAEVFERCPLEPFPSREEGRPEGCFRLRPRRVARCLVHGLDRWNRPTSFRLDLGKQISILLPSMCIGPTGEDPLRARGDDR